MTFYDDNISAAEEDLSSIGEGISSPEQQLEQLLKIMPADLIVMEAFKTLIKQMREDVEGYERLNGTWGIELTGEFHLNHGDADITLAVGRRYEMVKGTSYPRLLNKAIDDQQFKLDNKPLSLPRA
jgi:hypothetical protein